MVALNYVFGDIPTGRVFHVPADELRPGRQAEVRELTLLDDGRPVTIRDLVDGDDRADLRLGRDGDGELYLLSKQDDSVRALRRADPASTDQGGLAAEAASIDGEGRLVGLGVVTSPGAEDATILGWEGRQAG